MFELTVAWRYLVSKKSVNAINIINYISMTGMAIGAFALIVVLSVFNGFEELIKQLHKAFYPEIIIQTAQGKYLEHDSVTIRQLQKLNEVEEVFLTLEEIAYVEYGDRATIATIKGVSDNYVSSALLKDFVRTGKFILRQDNHEFAVVGANLNQALNVSVNNRLEPLKITVPKNSSASIFLPDDAFSSVYVWVSGIFSIQQEFDSKYVFVPLSTAQNLIGEERLISAYEVKLKNDLNSNQAKEKIERTLGNSFIVKTRDQINATLYRIVKIERWAVYAILSFILIIISFNILGSLSMLGIEKQKDISIMKAMGATPAQLRNIFLLEGVFSGGAGGLTGILAGLIVCYLQQKYGFVKLAQGGSSFVVDAYPVKVAMADICLSFTTVFIISALAAFIPAWKASQQPIIFSAE